jgi:hypothetical protein
MIVITNEKELFVEFPQNFNECTSEQLTALKELIAQSEITMPEFAIRWAQLCCEPDEFQLIVSSFAESETAEAFQMIAEHILQSTDLVMQKIPELLIETNNLGERKIRRLVGPENYLGNITYGQFIDADEQFWLYHKTKKEEHLNKLVAVLYRPVTEQLYEGRAKDGLIHERIGKQIPIEIRQTILDFYIGCRNFIAARFEHVFPKSDKPKKEILFSEIKNMREAFNTQMIVFAESPDRKISVYQTNAYTVLEFINHRIAEYKQRKKDLENAKNKPI